MKELMKVHQLDGELISILVEYSSRSSLTWPKRD